MKEDRYTLTRFNQQFPDDAACLDYIFDQRYPNGGQCVCGKKDSFYRVAKRRCYSCDRCGWQVSPCEGTVFHKSSTPLKTWFFAMFLMMSSKNGVSAKELERQVGVTYKTAWRMAHQIRKLMKQQPSAEKLNGVVEADETYVGGKILGQGQQASRANKTIVAGIVERGGDVRAKVVSDVKISSLVPHISQNVKLGSTVYTDELKSYQHLAKFGFVHAQVEHSRFEYVRAEVHTNSIEGFWSQLKRSVNGTFHQVSREHLQAYVDEFAFRYNRRASVTQAPIFPRLVERVGQKHD